MEPLMSMMKPDELEKFFSDVHQFSEETLPRLEALTDAWTEADHKDLQFGIELCSALQTARHFVSKASDYRLQKRLQMVHGYIAKIEKMEQKIGHVDRINPRTGIITKHVNHAVYVPADSVDENGIPSQPTDADKKKAYDKNVAPLKKKVEVTANDGCVKFAIPRPKHFDEWDDKMSSELRDDVAELNTYFTELAAADEILRSLFKNPLASKSDLSTAAKRVHAWDKKILAIYYRADVEWANLTGQTAMLEDPDKAYFEKADHDANKILGITQTKEEKKPSIEENLADDAKSVEMMSSDTSLETEVKSEARVEATAEEANAATAESSVEATAEEANAATAESNAEAAKPKRTRRTRTKKA